MVECTWAIVPAVILIRIAVPLLIYYVRRPVDAALTIKVLGHQWYWRYEYTDFWRTGSEYALRFNARMVSAAEKDMINFRLLDVDNWTVVPFNTHICGPTSSAGVLHSWTVPSLGVKADAVPWRLNQVKLIAQRSGTYFGEYVEILWGESHVYANCGGGCQH